MTTDTRPNEMTELERWFKNVEKRPNGCWIWLGGMGHDGYGNLKRGRKLCRAHRAFYEVLVGPIPDGLVLDHTCNRPRCVNPAHLEPVTSQVNSQRAVERRRERRQRWRNEGMVDIVPLTEEELS